MLHWAPCFDWLDTFHVLFSTLWWWWCIMIRPLLELRLLTTFLLFFLPDHGWPWPLWIFIINSHYLSNPSRITLDNTNSYQWWTLEHFWTILDRIYPYILYLLPCVLNLLTMFCARVCSGVMGCWTATRALSLRSFPGVTLAQVGFQ